MDLVLVGRRRDSGRNEGVTRCLVGGGGGGGDGDGEVDGDVDGRFRGDIVKVSPQPAATWNTFQ